MAKTTKRKTKRTAKRVDVMTTLLLDADTLAAIDDMSGRGVFPPRIGRTRAARIRFCCRAVPVLLERLEAAHRANTNNADLVDAYLLPIKRALHALGDAQVESERLDLRETDLWQIR